VLRESVSSEGVLDTILGIGALAQAIDGAPRGLPLYMIPLSEYSTSSHYTGAIRYYNKSLVKLRHQISSSDTNASPRTLLMSTILFSAFELLHGNTISADKHLASGVSILKDTIIQSAWPDKRSKIATACDDVGIEDAEYILVLRLTFKHLLSPSYSKVKDSISVCVVPYTMGPQPPAQSKSYEVFWKLWMRFLTVALLWYVRIGPPTNSDYYASDIDWVKLHKERTILLSQIKAWETALRIKSVEELDPYGRQMLRQILPGLKALHFSVHIATDNTVESEDEANEIAHEVNRLAEGVLDETPIFQTGLGEIYGGILAISIVLSRNCRDFEVRSKAMSICKRLVNAHSRWDGKEILMGTSALIALEEAGRDKTGSIPLELRYDWVSSSWNDDYTQLAATFATRAVNHGSLCEEIQLTLYPEDYGLV
jgi:hypothetical protein